MWSLQPTADGSWVSDTVPLQSPFGTPPHVYCLGFYQQWTLARQGRNQKCVLCCLCLTKLADLGGREGSLPRAPVNSGGDDAGGLGGLGVPEMCLLHPSRHLRLPPTPRIWKGNSFNVTEPKWISYQGYWRKLVDTYLWCSSDTKACHFKVKCPKEDTTKVLCGGVSISWSSLDPLRNNFLGLEIYHELHFHCFYFFKWSQNFESKCPQFYLFLSFLIISHGTFSSVVKSVLFISVI